MQETVKYIPCLTVAYEETCCFKHDINIKQRIIHHNWLTVTDLLTYIITRQTLNQKTTTANL